MWTPEQQAEIQGIAKAAIPGIITSGIPTGLQMDKGPDAIVEYLVGNVDNLGIRRK
jgi:hypothetical protein